MRAKIHIRAYVCMKYIHESLHTLIYIHTYMNTYTHTYAHIHTCTHAQVARSRGGYYAEEELDPDAPSDSEMQIFLRNCLPLRLTAAKQMGMQALPGAQKVSQMQVGFFFPFYVCQVVYE
jgi:hypothetical protein